MPLVLEEHRHYLTDSVRLSAFRRAIAEVVRLGDIVLDLGSGTGILGLLACQAGARRVYAVDHSGMIEVARAIGHTNGFHDRMVFIKALSTQVTLPEHVDVVVADQIGGFGIDAGIVEYFCDARTRFLKPGGVMIPARLELSVAPVETPQLWECLTSWERTPAGLKFEPVRTLAANTCYPASYRPEHVLGEPIVLTVLDPSLGFPALQQYEGRSVVHRSGTVHGIGGWFSAQLSPGVTMSNAPLAKEPISRRQVFFPIEQPVSVETDDWVQVRMTIEPTTLLITWIVEIWGPAPVRKARFVHSAFRGLLLSREDLQRMQPQFVPRLSSWGQARRTILELCDGHRSVAVIEQELRYRHPHLFSSPQQVAAFVAQVIAQGVE